MFKRLISLTVILSMLSIDLVRAMESDDEGRERTSLPVRAQQQQVLQRQEELKEEEHRWEKTLETLKNQKTDLNKRQEALRSEEAKVREDLERVNRQKPTLQQEKQKLEEEGRQWQEKREREDAQLKQEEEDYQNRVEEARRKQAEEDRRHSQEAARQNEGFQAEQLKLLESQRVAQETLQRLEVLETKLSEAVLEEEELQRRHAELKQEKERAQEDLKRVQEQQKQLRRDQESAEGEERQWQAQRREGERQRAEEVTARLHRLSEARRTREEEDSRFKQTLEGQKEALQRQEQALRETELRAQEEGKSLSLQQKILKGEKAKWAKDNRDAQGKLDACLREQEETSSVLSSSPPSTFSSGASRTTSSPSSSPENDSLLDKRSKKKSNERTPLLKDKKGQGSIQGDTSLKDFADFTSDCVFVDSGIGTSDEAQIPFPNKQLILLAFAIPSEEDATELKAVIHLEEQLIDEEVLVKKARLLYSKIKGTSLEDFGKYYKGHIIDNKYRLEDYGGLIVAGVMATGTAAAMPPIVEWSLYNKYTAKWLDGGVLIEAILAYYINSTTALIALTDAVSFMLEATSPSMRTFTVPKSRWEKAADWFLVPPAGIPGIFLLLLGFQVQQEHKKATDTSGWWNEYDQYFYFSSLGFFPYLFAKTFNGMRLAVSRVFHPTVPEHVKSRVVALRQLDARLDYLTKPELSNLYDLLKNPIFGHNTSKLKELAKYSFKGEMSDICTVEGLLTYLCITKYAQETMKEEGEELQTSGYKNMKSRIMGALGIPAGFGVIAISLYGTFQAFMDPKAALALSLTGATLGFLPGAFLESHNLQESLDTLSKGIVPYLKGGKLLLVDTLKDPYSWVKGTVRAVAFTQNLLTYIFPILVSLAILIPEALEVDETIQEIITGGMLLLAIPYVLSGLINGTIDIQGHVMKIAYFIQNIHHAIHEFIAYCCRKSKPTSSATRERRMIKGWLRETITTTLRFTPEHIEKLDDLAQCLKGEN